MCVLFHDEFHFSLFPFFRFSAFPLFRFVPPHVFRARRTHDATVELSFNFPAVLIFCVVSNDAQVDKEGSAAQGLRGCQPVSTLRAPYHVASRDSQST